MISHIQAANYFSSCFCLRCISTYNAFELVPTTPTPGKMLSKTYIINKCSLFLNNNNNVCDFQSIIGLQKSKHIAHIGKKERVCCYSLQFNKNKKLSFRSIMLFLTFFKLHSHNEKKTKITMLSSKEIEVRCYNIQLTKYLASISLCNSM